MPSQLTQRITTFIERITLQAAVDYCHDGHPKTLEKDADTARQLLRELRKQRDQQADSDSLNDLMLSLKQIRDGDIHDVLADSFSSKDVKQPFNSLADRDRAFIAAHYLQKKRGSHFDKYFTVFATHDQSFLHSVLATLDQQHRQHCLSSQELASHIAQEILTPDSQTLQAIRMHRWIETMRLAWPTQRRLAEAIYQGLQQAKHASTALKYVAEPQQSFFKHFASELVQHPQHSGIVQAHPSTYTASSQPQVLAELLPGRHLGTAADNALIQHIHTLFKEEDGLATVAAAIDTCFKNQIPNAEVVAQWHNSVITLPAEAVRVLDSNEGNPPTLTATKVEASRTPQNHDRPDTAHATIESLYQPFDALFSRLQHLIIASVLQDSLVTTHFDRVDQWLQVAERLKSQQKHYEAEAIVSSLRMALADYVHEPFWPNDLKDDLKAHRNRVSAFNANTAAHDPRLAQDAAALAEHMMNVDDQKLYRSTSDFGQHLIQMDRRLYWAKQLKNPALSEWLIHHPDAMNIKPRSKHFKAYQACSTRKVDSAEYRTALSEFMDTRALSKTDFDEIYRHSKQTYYHQLFENSVLRDVLKSFHLSKQGLKTDFFEQGTEQLIQLINQAAHQPHSNEAFRQHLASLGIHLAEKTLQLIQNENHRLHRVQGQIAVEPQPIQRQKAHRTQHYDSTQAPTSTNDSPLSSTASESQAEEHHHNQLHGQNKDAPVASKRQNKTRQDLL